MSLLAACSNDDGFTNGKDLLVFKPNKKLKFGDISFSAKMKASFSTDTILIQLRSENKGEKRRSLNLEAAQILGRNGIRSSPVAVSKSRRNLKANSVVIDTLYFAPINDMKLFKNTDLKGEFAADYFFVPGGIVGTGFASQNIKLSANEQNYEQYKDSQPQIDLTIYDISKTEETVENLKQKAAELVAFGNGTQAGKSTSGDVKITKKEILMNGLATLVKAYQRDNEVSVLWKMVNHQGVPLEVNPEDFRLITSTGTDLELVDIKYIIKPNGWSASDNTLQKGERIGAHFTFGGSMETIALVPAIRFGDANNLFDSIPLEIVTEPR